VIDGGPCGLTPTTVVDMSQGEPEVMRVGAGSVADLGLSVPA
jgi:tRNA A37 threonylcarbamoyladenosine synthetase subunit TsaC/SUA5/YrdC